MSRMKKLYRIPAKGKVKGVCAGFAEYLDIPVWLVRTIVILSMIFGLFLLTLAAYFILAMILDEKPLTVNEGAENMTTSQLLAQVGAELNAGERRLREMERYVTSETFNVRSRFSQL